MDDADSERTNLYYYRARYYSPKLGRFLQTDPVGTQDDLGLYVYAGNDPLNAVDPGGTATCANPDCSLATIDSFVARQVPILRELAGAPNAPGTTVGFENDDPKSANNPASPVQTELAVSVETALRDSTATSININSSERPYDPKNPGSHHAKHNAVDVNRIDNKRVDDPANAGAVSDLQGALSEQSGIRENYGPASQTRTDVAGNVVDRSDNKSIVEGHQNHVHASSQACNRDPSQC